MNRLAWRRPRVGHVVALVLCGALAALDGALLTCYLSPGSVCRERGETASASVTPVSASSAPSDPQRAIDVVFVPSKRADGFDLADATDAARFRSLVATSVAYLRDQNAVVRANPTHFNFHAADTPGDHVRACTKGEGWPLIDLPAWVDVVAIAHTAEGFRDCRLGRYMTAELPLAPNDVGTASLVHEFGHAAFGLPDAACCVGGYWPSEPTLAIFSEVTATQQEKLRPRFKADPSAASGGGTIWVRGDDAASIMYDTSTAPPQQFGAADWAVIRERLRLLDPGDVREPSAFAPPLP